VLPSYQFQVLFNSLFKVLFIFPLRYLFAIGLSCIFSFRWSLPPSLGQHSQAIRLYEHMYRTRVISCHIPKSKTGFSPSLIPCSKRFIPRLLADYFISEKCVSSPQFDHPAWSTDFRVELYSLHSLLLRVSLLVSSPPLNNMLKFSGSSRLIRVLAFVFYLPIPRKGCKQGLYS